MEGLKKRWGLKSNLQLTIVFIVFAVTGSTSAYVTRMLLGFMNISSENLNYLLYLLIYIVTITPIYFVLLLTFGTLFGEFPFFSKFIKRLLIKMKLGFIVNLLEK
jgi:manganese efflux pump family protein